jgi:hypothetical protein
MTPEAPREDVLVLPDEPWAARYEELRQFVMARADAIDNANAHSLLIRRGVVAWMKAWPRRGPALQPSRDRGFCPAVDDVTVPSQFLRSAASLLVNMFLTTSAIAEVPHEQRFLEGLAQTP